LLLNIHRITEKGLHLDFERRGFELGPGAETIALGPVKASIDLGWQEGVLHIWGEVTAQVQLRCSRCTRIFSLSLQESFGFATLPKQEIMLPDNLRLAAEDMEVVFLEGEEIDLEEIVRENIHLALPIQPLCSESCQGLCPVCGKDRNEGKCPCFESQIDPRLRPLERLRGFMNPES